MTKPDFNKLGGLLPVIVQDWQNGEVLMFAFMNEEAFSLTCESNIAHFFSRSRNSIWKKGESSGNIQQVKEIRIDCDADTLLMKVEQTGAACHEGYRSCFFRIMENSEFKIDQEPIMDPLEMYGGKK